MNGVNFYRTYQLDEIYEHVKEKSGDILAKYLDYPELYKFDDEKKSLTFKSERLIPTKYTNRPRVLLLFSNPHPHSVHQGMLLSPNTRGKENPFWETMRDAGWMNFKEEQKDPLQIANLCFNSEYQGPFDFVFYPYYSFPSNYPIEIKKIFGRDYFKKVIEPEARNEFMKTIQDTELEAVVAFNKDVFNLVSEKIVDKYINRLINGELVESRVRAVKNEITTFLTFPTGWRYHEEIKLIKSLHLKSIRKVIEDNLNSFINK